jgi:hypothetical protein
MTNNDISYNQKLKSFIDEIGGSEKDFLNHEIQRLNNKIDVIEKENKGWRDDRNDLKGNFKALRIVERIQECEDLIFDYTTRLERFPKEDIKIVKQYNSESFELFDKVRHNDINDYDMTILLREYSKNYDIELLKSLSKDVSFYLFVEKEEKEAEFDLQDIQEAIDKRKESRLEIPYIKPIKPKNLTEKQKKIIEKTPLNTNPILDKEALLFPYEFFSVRKFQLKINDKINELQDSINKTNSNIKFNVTSTEMIELIKSLIENGCVKGKQKEIINAFSVFFNVEVKHPNKLINDIKNRNVGSETLFLDKLKTSLYNYITK